MYQVLRGGGWTYGGVSVTTGMIVQPAPGNNQRLTDMGYICAYDGDTEALPHCGECGVHFINDAVQRQHIDQVHAQGLKEMKAKRHAIINDLQPLREQRDALTVRVDELHAVVLGLDKQIAEAEEAYATAGLTPPEATAPAPATPKTAYDEQVEKYLSTVR